MGVPLDVLHCDPLLQQVAPRPPDCGHDRSLGQQRAAPVVASITHTLLLSAQQRSPHTRPPPGQHTPPNPPEKPEGL